MINKEILAELYANQDLKYKDFQSKLTPDLSPDDFIGVRTPALKKLAKEFAKREDVGEFLDSLPHKYFDENQLHAFILSEMKDYDRCVACLEEFLPYVNNWATCDQMSPKVFKKNTADLLKHINKWIDSDKVYTVRYGIVSYMRYYLDGEFKPEYLEAVAGIKSDEYYINMAIARYFATALAKQYEATVKYIEGRVLEPWTRNKAIQKAIESYRVSDEHKKYLRSLKIK